MAHLEPTGCRVSYGQVKDEVTVFGVTYASAFLSWYLQGKCNGHRSFRLSPGVHEDDIAYNGLGFLARRFRDVVEQLRDFGNAQHGLPHNPWDGPCRFVAKSLAPFAPWGAGIKRTGLNVLAVLCAFRPCS
jgi:hypothetical protein